MLNANIFKKLKMVVLKTLKIKLTKYTSYNNFLMSLILFQGGDDKPVYGLLVQVVD